MTNFLVLLTIGIIVQFFISFITTNSMNVGNRGNPAAFLPATAFFILSGSTFWKIYIGYQDKKFILSLLAILFLFGSALSMYALSPGSAKINLLWVIYGLLLFLSTFAINSKYIWKKIMIMLGVLLVFMLANENPVVDYIIPNFLALYICAMVRSKYFLKNFPFILIDHSRSSEQ